MPGTGLSTVPRRKRCPQQPPAQDHTTSTTNTCTGSPPQESAAVANVGAWAGEGQVCGVLTGGESEDIPAGITY